MHRRSIELRNHPLGVPTSLDDGERNMNKRDNASACLTSRSQRPVACDKFHERVLESLKNENGINYKCDKEILKKR